MRFICLLMNNHALPYSLYSECSLADSSLLHGRMVLRVSPKRFLAIVFAWRFTASLRLLGFLLIALSLVLLNSESTRQAVTVIDLLVKSVCEKVAGPADAWIGEGGAVDGGVEGEEGVGVDDGDGTDGSVVGAEAASISASVGARVHTATSLGTRERTLLVSAARTVLSWLALMSL